MKPTRRSPWPKWLKRLAFVGAALITLVVLILTIEGYRAKRAWLACEEELESRGEKLHWSELGSAPVPDDQNFLATPALAPCFGFKGTGVQDDRNCDQLTATFIWASHLPGPGDWRKGTVFGLNQWQSKLRGNPLDDIREVMEVRYGLRPAETPPDQQPAPHPADDCPPWAELRSRPVGTPIEDLQFLLDHDRALLDEIREAARRPYAQLPMADVPDFGAWMPQYAKLKSLIHPFRASCWGELVAGRAEVALKDFETMLALGDAASSQPVLIGLLVRIAMVDLAVQPLWAGLAEHRWADTDLARLERILGQLNVIADAQRCLRGERAFALTMVSINSGEEDGRISTELNSMRRAMRFWPSAMIYRNRINLAQAYQALLIDRLDPAGPSVRLQSNIEEQALRKEFGKFSLYNCFTPQLLPAVEKSLEKAALGQVIVTLARTATALERFTLANDAYPETLNELVPAFIAALPVDPINGGPLHYRREAQDQFVLYSVGLNGQDDGGVVEPARAGGVSGVLSALEGDVVWRNLAGADSQ